MLWYILMIGVMFWPSILIAFVATLIPFYVATNSKAMTILKLERY